MNDRFVDSRETLSYVLETLKNGTITETRRWADLAPQSEDAWLILGMPVCPGESVVYIRKTLDMKKGNGAGDAKV